MTNIQKIIEFKKNLASYLLELKELTGVNVDSESLYSLDEVEQILRETSFLKNVQPNKLVIEFEKKNSTHFKQFVERLSKVNNKPVYIWTHRANICGLYRFSSIDQVNFSFSFNVNSEGIIVFLTEDLSDQLLLDFYYDDNDQEALEIEWKGKNWSSLSFEEST